MVEVVFKVIVFQGDVNVDFIAKLYKEENEQYMTGYGACWADLLIEDMDQYYPTFPDIYRPYFWFTRDAEGDKEVCKD